MHTFPTAKAAARGRLTERLWLLFHESWKYFLVSVVCLAIDLSVYQMLVASGHVNYLAANIASVSSGLALNYWLSIRLVFVERRLRDARAQFLGFVLIGVAGLAVNELCLGFFVSLFGLAPLAGKIAAAGVSFTFNFGLRRILLFTSAR
jgi:putative flippase GtrA